MNSNLLEIGKMLLIAIIVITLQYVFLGFVVNFSAEEETSLFKTIVRIGGMMFFINFLAYFIVVTVHKIQPQKSVFVYFFAILLKMILVIFLILKFPGFKDHVILVMFNYIAFLGLTIYFLKNRILG